MIRLNVHLPNEKYVVLSEGDELGALRRSASKLSQLEAFFLLNRTDPRVQRLTYLEVPHECCWYQRATQ